MSMLITHTRIQFYRVKIVCSFCLYNLLRYLPIRQLPNLPTIAWARHFVFYSRFSRCALLHLLCPFIDYGLIGQAVHTCRCILYYYDFGNTNHWSVLYVCIHGGLRFHPQTKLHQIILHLLGKQQTPQMDLKFTLMTMVPRQSIV